MCFWRELYLWYCHVFCCSRNFDFLEWRRKEVCIALVGWGEGSVEKLQLRRREERRSKQRGKEHNEIDRRIKNSENGGKREYMTVSKYERVFGLYVTYGTSEKMYNIGDNRSDFRVLHLPVTSSLLCPNILFSILFSHTICVCCSFRLRMLKILNVLNYQLQLSGCYSRR